MEVNLGKHLTFGMIYQKSDIGLMFYMHLNSIR